ncbi:MAG: hypothetical protein HYY95_25895 [Candidatus Rokubacteria bacterium]|nr:hypothetical protein [Candidatus Rokubacteria bacterium]
MSIALAWCDFKTYCEEIGPGRGQPPRPAQCVFCDGLRVWFNGWRRVLPTLLVDGRPHRPSEWVALQRVRCARGACGRSWTLRPPWLYPHRSLEPDIAEAAALAYLLDPHTSYAAVATAVGCAWITVGRWVGWLAALVGPGTLVAAAARVGATGGAEPGLLPREVPAAARARSTARARTVRQAAQVLGALALLHRAQPEPPADPSPLRWWLLAEFLAFRRLALLTRGTTPRR